jgi:hypothetical protein
MTNIHRRARAAALLSFAVLAPAVARAAPFRAGDLIVSYSVYQGTAASVAVGQVLPGGGRAVANGAYPGVFNNASVDPSFGITSPIYLQNARTANGITATSRPTLDVTALTGVTTSFPSKSELGITLSADGGSITLLGYTAPINALDISNSNTPGVIEPGNPVTSTPTARAVVQVNANGTALVTPTNAYSGNNGRNVALASNGKYYLVGNAGNGNGSPQITATTGVQLATPGVGTATNPQNTSQVGFYNITQNGYTADKTAKDNNYRGLTIFNDTVYVTKGSGSNGINTVYQVGNGGTLPTATNAPISILPGFNTRLARGQTCTASNCSNYYAPFGLFFANANTLYVSDEGNAGTVNDPNAGLQKWSLVNGTWQLDYVLQNGLSLYQSYSVDGLSSSYNPYVTGLRNLTGRLNGDGTVTFYAATSTNSASGDAGADPNAIVTITDQIGATTLPGAESFSIYESPQFGVVYRGVALAPVPAPGGIALFAAAAGGLAALRRRRAA